MDKSMCRTCAARCYGVSGIQFAASNNINAKLALLQIIGRILFILVEKNVASGDNVYIDINWMEQESEEEGNTEAITWAVDEEVKNEEPKHPRAIINYWYRTVNSL